MIIAATVGLTQLAAHTPYWTLSGLLFLLGMGMGGAMMPIMSGAMKTLRRAAIAKASTTLSIIQQVGASIGTAVVSVMLVNELTDRLPASAGGGDGLGAANVPDRVREQIAPVMAEAFGATFWRALGLLVLAFAAAFLLPFERTEALDEPAEEDAAPVAIPV